MNIKIKRTTLNIHPLRYRYSDTMAYTDMNETIRKRVKNKRCQHCGKFIKRAGYCGLICEKDLRAAFKPLQEELESYE